MEQRTRNLYEYIVQDRQNTVDKTKNELKKKNESYYLEKNYEIIQDKKDLTECKAELDRLRSIHSTYQRRMEKRNQELLQHC